MAFRTHRPLLSLRPQFPRASVARLPQAAATWSARLGSSQPCGRPLQPREGRPCGRPVRRSWGSEFAAVPPPFRIPSHLQRPAYAGRADGMPRPLRDDEWGEVKGPDAIDRMRRAGHLAASARDVALEASRAGATTADVDLAVCSFVVANGGYPAGINYCGFPAGICASPNEVALHGVPNMRPMESGDIVNFDVTVFLDGFFADCSEMACIGEVDEDARRLVDATRECLAGAIELLGPGVQLSRVGDFCSELAGERGFGIVSAYCGHFIGSLMHMEPMVEHVPNGTALSLRPGMTFTIEPILVEGGSGDLEGPLQDGWAYVTKTGGWSAQCEHTVLITEHGCDILTLAS